MHKQNTTNTGFTLVELLIVIVVIAILATISVVAYSGIQDRAVATAVKSDLSNFAKKIEIAKVDTSDGLYPVVPTQGMGIRATKSMYKTTHIGTGVNRVNWYYCSSPDRTDYALGVVDSKDRGYIQSSLRGLEEKVNGNGNIQDSTSVCDEVGSPSLSVHPGMNGGIWQNWVN